MQKKFKKKIWSAHREKEASWESILLKNEVRSTYVRSDRGEFIPRWTALQDLLKGLWRGDDTRWKPRSAGEGTGHQTGNNMYPQPLTVIKKQKLVMHYVVYNVGRIHINESIQLSDEIVKHRYIVWRADYIKLNMYTVTPRTSIRNIIQKSKQKI